MVSETGELLRADRVLKGQKEDLILDFKTGTKDPKHFEQVLKYVSTLSLATSKPCRGILIYTQPFELVEVVGG